MGDAREYDAWAQRIAGGDWVGSGVFYQAPLYPYFVGAVYALFGRDLAVLRVIQALLGSVSCVLVAYAAGRLISKPAGAVAGFALAFYAPAIFFDGLVQKSVLDVLFVSAALALVASLDARPQARPGGVGGARRGDGVPGADARERAGAVAGDRGLGLVSAAAAAPPRAWPPAALVTAGALLGLAPVAVRNYAVGGGAVPDHVAAGPELLHRQQPDGGRHLPPAAVRPRVGRVRAPGRHGDRRARGWDGGSSRTRCRATGWGARGDFIVADPADVAAADGTQDGAAGEPRRDAGHREPGGARRVVVAARRAAAGDSLRRAGAAGPPGLWATWADRRRLWILYAMVLTYAASTVAFYVFARYRYPLVPILLVFAAAGVTNATRASVARAPRWPRRRWPPSPRTGRCCRPAGCAPSAKRTSAWRCSRAASTANAQARYRAALAIEPDYPPAYNNLGRGAARPGPRGRGRRRLRGRPSPSGRLSRPALQPGQRAQRNGTAGGSRGGVPAGNRPASRIPRRRIATSATCWRRKAGRPQAWIRFAARWRWRPTTIRGGVRPGNAAARGATVR